MQMETKRIQKDDGRYLIYCHFPESATPEESAVFAAVNEAEVNGGTDTERGETENSGLETKNNGLETNSSGAGTKNSTADAQDNRQQEGAAHV